MAQGRIFMTHPTKAVYSMLLTDAARVGGSEHSLYSAKDVEHSLAKVEVLDFHQTITVDGVQVSSQLAPCSCICSAECSALLR